MKQNYLLIILGVLILGGSTVKAQVKERGFFIEMNAGYGANDKWQDYAVLTPGVGYQFNKYCALGVKMSFETGDWPSHKIYTPFFRCNYLTIHRFQLFGELQANFARVKDFSSYPVGVPIEFISDYDEVGITLGATFSITSHLRVKGEYLFLGWSNEDENGLTSEREKEGFIADGHVRRFQLGLQVIF